MWPSLCVRIQKKSWQMAVKRNWVGRARLLRPQRGDIVLEAGKQVLWEEHGKAGRTANFPFQPWDRGWERKRMWENKQSLPKKQCPWDGARFQWRPGGVRNIMWRGTAAPEGSDKGWEESSGRMSQEGKYRAIWERDCEDRKPERLVFWSLQGFGGSESCKQWMAGRFESEVWNTAVLVLVLVLVQVFSESVVWQPLRYFNQRNSRFLPSETRFP